ncbi:MAG: protein kinase [Gemmatimonadales bacterium]
MLLESRLADALGTAYTIEGEIGRGGMGVVYRARDERLKRPVAIKVLPPDLAYRADIRQRFLREAETAARLSHPNIVPIHTVGDKDDLCYFVMGLVDGESLALRLKRRGRLSIEEARRVMRESADALSAAHAQGVIHRDVKPDNILLEGTRGRVMVTDFGIAKALTSDGGTLTEAGVAIGTPAYMSPEQAAGDRNIDGRSDLYSLGVVAYQMLTGELPFQAPTVPALLMKQISETPVPVNRKRPETPDELSLTVMRCLEKDPEDRWNSADALRRALETNTYTAPPPRPGARAKRGPAVQSDARGDLPAVGRGDDARDARDWLASRRGELPDKLARRKEKLSRRLAQFERKVDRKLDKKEQEEREIQELAKQAGEPVMITRFRRQLATYVMVNGMFMLIGTLGHTHFPWALIAGFWGIAIARGYARLWSAGYSWRDVIHRKPAHDAVEAATVRGPAGLLAAPVSAQEFGRHASGIEQARADRAAVIAMIDRMSKSERQMLPEIAPTVDQLLERAADLARSLAVLERDLEPGALERIDSRVAALDVEPQTADSQRRLALLQQQKEKIVQLEQRRTRLGEQLESSLLAMQNIRFDLLRLRSSGVAEALGDLTQATQQAKALSRDVDAVISAAREVKRLTGQDSPTTPVRPPARDSR